MDVTCATWKELRQVRLEGHIFKHFAGHTRIFDKAFVAVPGITRRSVMTLVLVWPAHEP